MLRMAQASHRRNFYLNLHTLVANRIRRGCALWRGGTIAERERALLGGGGDVVPLIYINRNSYIYLWFSQESLPADLASSRRRRNDEERSY